MNELDNLMLINIILAFMMIISVVFFLRGIFLFNKKIKQIDQIVEKDIEEFLLIRELGL